MRLTVLRALLVLTLGLCASPAVAADYPAPKQGEWIARDFKFHTGEVLPELRLNYTTLGDPKNEAVLILHGTTGSGAGMLNPAQQAALRTAVQPVYESFQRRFGQADFGSQRRHSAVPL